MTAAEPSIAEMSRQVAEAKDWELLDPILDDGALWELEGELQQVGWVPMFDEGAERWRYVKSSRFLAEPGTPEGRIRLVLRAWLEEKC